MARLDRIASPSVGEVHAVRWTSAWIVADGESRPVEARPGVATNGTTCGVIAGFAKRPPAAGIGERTSLICSTGKNVMLAGVREGSRYPHDAGGGKRGFWYGDAERSPVEMNRPLREAVAALCSSGTRGGRHPPLSGAPAKACGVGDVPWRFSPTCLLLESRSRTAMQSRQEVRGEIRERASASWLLPRDGQNDKRKALTMAESASGDEPMAPAQDRYATGSYEVIRQIRSLASSAAQPLLRRGRRARAVSFRGRPRPFCNATTAGQATGMGRAHHPRLGAKRRHGPTHSRPWGKSYTIWVQRY